MVGVSGAGLDPRPSAVGQGSMAKQDKLERVPPIFPIIWQDWDSDPDVLSMTTVEEGLYFKLLKKQWVLGELPADPWKLSKLLGIQYRTTKHWLSKYSHLTVKVQRPCSEHAPTMQSGCSKCAVSMHNKKLKNYRIDVISDVALGTTEPKLTKQNRSEPLLPQQVEEEAVEEAPETPTPEQEKVPESKVDDSKVRKAVTHLLKLLGSPDKFNKKSVCKRWESLIEPKLQNAAVEYVTGLMDYALTENPVWVRAFSGLSKRDPMEYFVEKYETIEGNRDGDEKFKKMKKSTAASGSAAADGAPEYMKEKLGWDR